MLEASFPLEYESWIDLSCDHDNCDELNKWSSGALCI